MSEERKSDLEGAFAELEYEINLAIQQSTVPVPFEWRETFTGPDGKPWIALMRIGKLEAA